MIYLVMFLKSAAWAVAFWLGINRALKGMLLSSAAIAVFLTVTDKLTVSADLALVDILLTLLLYAMMSFLLLPIAWKLKDPAVSLACNVTGTLGALAVVNFTMDFIRTYLSL